jgi:DNA-binding CsgD family transcriptional regulator
LFQAEKSVAAHLSNIYGKLEIRSRVQLSVWLAEHDEATEAQTA